MVVADQVEPDEDGRVVDVEEVQKVWAVTPSAEAALTGVDEMQGFNLSTVTVSSFEPTRRRKTLAPRSRTS